MPLFPDGKVPQDYSICELNISIIKYESIPINFLLNNGLYAICLQYEYLYQLSFILFKNTKNNDSDISLISKEARDIISNILNNSITILLKYSNQILNYLVLAKNILLNLFNAIKYFNRMNIKIMNDSSIKNICIILICVIDYIKNKKEYNINNNDINNLVDFRDGLIDFLLTSTLYDKDKKELINFIFDMLFPLN